MTLWLVKNLIKINININDNKAITAIYIFKKQRRQITKYSQQLYNNSVYNYNKYSIFPHHHWKNKLTDYTMKNT